MTTIGGARLRCLWLCAGIVLSGALSACSAHDRTEDSEGFYRDALRGGRQPAPCDWPAVVALDLGCSGALVHPEVVVYAAHCGRGVRKVSFGPDVDAPFFVVTTDRCAAHPEAALGNGYDVAFCLLTEPVEHVPPLRIAPGCELGGLKSVTPATLVGFGLDRNAGAFGIKRSGEILLSSFSGDLNAPADLVVPGGEVGSCAGDSGAPLVIDVSLESHNTSPQQRLIGVVSAADAAACSPTTDHYSYLPPLLPWLEAASGRDLTPCFDADGTWNPTPRCTQSATQYVGSAQGAEPTAAICATMMNTPVLSNGCGTAFPPERLADITAPELELFAPVASEVLLEDGEVAHEMAVEVSASDAHSGVEAIRFELADDHGAVRADERDEVPPYRLDHLRLPPGAWNLRVTAQDHAGNETETRRSILVKDSPGHASGCTFQRVPARERNRTYVFLLLGAAALVSRFRASPPGFKRPP